MEGFDESDFAFLQDGERHRLRQSVEEFRAAAGRVPPNAPATNKDVQQALPPFRSILEIIRPDKYADADALVIGKQLEQSLANKLPSWVRDLRFESGQDASGEPAVWLWVIIDDEAAKDEDWAKNTQMVRALLRSAIEQIAGGRWPFIRFRTVSEQAENAKVEDKR